MSTQVVVNQDTCIGCGVCAALCATVYEMSAEDGKSYVISGKDTVEGAEADSAKEACGACPVNAIATTDVANDNRADTAEAA